jgi:hypothetical protein
MTIIHNNDKSNSANRRNHLQNNAGYYQQKRQERGQYGRGNISIDPNQQKLLDYMVANSLKPAELADRVGLQAPVLLDWLYSDQPLALHMLPLIGPLIGLVEVVTTASADDNEPALPVTLTKTQRQKQKKASQKPKTGNVQEQGVEFATSAPPFIILANTTMATDNNTANSVAATTTPEVTTPQSLPAELLASSSTPDTSATTPVTVSTSPKAGPTPPRPISTGQVEMIRVLLIKFRRSQAIAAKDDGAKANAEIEARNDEAALVAKLGKPLEQLTYTQASDIITQLTEQTHGGLIALKAQQQQAQALKNKQK